MFTHTLTTVTIGGKEHRRLVSQPKVSELVVHQPERLLLMVLMGTKDGLADFNNDDVTRVLSAHSQNTTNYGWHYCDCVQQGCTCLLCVTEMDYDRAVDFEEEAQAAGVTMDLATLILGTEYACDTYQTLSDYYDKYGHDGGYVAQDTSVAARLVIWNNLTEEQKTKAVERAAKFRYWLQVQLPDEPADIDTAIGE